MEITKDMLPTTQDIYSIKTAIEKTEAAKRKNFETLILTSIAKINDTISADAENGYDSSRVYLDPDVKNYLVEPLRSAGYKVYVFEHEDYIKYNISWDISN